MKTKLTLGLSVLLAVGFNVLARAATPAPLPEFMDKQQLAKWTADTQTAEAKAVAVDPASDQFYTGKPYVTNDGGYVYKYRTYNPEMSRWTTADPSGFPDGVNNRFYSPTPTSFLDPLGAWTIQLTSSSNPAINTNSGSVSAGTISAGAELSTDITSSFTGSSGTVNGEGSGEIVDSSLAITNITDTTLTFTVSVDDSGNISISPTGGGWQNVDGDLQIGSNYGAIISGQSATLSFDSASIYNGSGLSGAGANVGSLGGSVSWTSGSGKVDAFVTLSFQAEE